MPRLFAIALLAALAAAVPASAAPRSELLEVFSPDGAISRVEVPLRDRGTVTRAEAAALEDSALTPIQVTGPSENRFDLVMVGDGYTADQMDLFHEHALAQWERTRTTEPFTEYAAMFNVWMVDVVSAESGVDNDPRPPTMKATALDMQFYCQGTERALCVNEAKARAAASAAPEADQVLAIANSTKYGGVGGTTATVSGGSSAASLITVHELGHSLGKLADEYDYYYRAGLDEDSTKDVRIPAPYLLYPGAALGEPSGTNCTRATSGSQLVTQKLKWWRWVGEPAHEGGTVGAYEGACYYRYGNFRPSPDSLMHTLGQGHGGNEFNAPSAEQMVRYFYRKVSPVDAASPAANATVAPGTAVELDLVQPASHPLDVRWYVDGVEVASARGSERFDVDASMAAGASSLRVVVRDPSAFVRDPAYLDGDLTQALDWSI